MSPSEAEDLQEFLTARLTMFPEAVVSVTAKRGGAVVKVKLEDVDDEFEVNDDALEWFRRLVVIL